MFLYYCCGASVASEKQHKQDLRRIYRREYEFSNSLLFTTMYCIVGAVVAQLASVRLSEREVPGSIFSDFNVCFDFPLIRVAIALNKTEH